MQSAEQNSVDQAPQNIMDNSQLVLDELNREFEQEFPGTQMIIESSEAPSEDKLEVFAKVLCFWYGKIPHQHSGGDNSNIIDPRMEITAGICKKRIDETLAIAGQYNISQTAIHNYIAAHTTELVVDGGEDGDGSSDGSDQDVSSTAHKSRTGRCNMRRRKRNAERRMPSCITEHGIPPPPVIQAPAE